MQQNEYLFAKRSKFQRISAILHLKSNLSHKATEGHSNLQDLFDKVRLKMLGVFMLPQPILPFYFKFFFIKAFLRQIMKKIGQKRW